MGLFLLKEEYGLCEGRGVYLIGEYLFGDISPEKIGGGRHKRVLVG